MMTHRSTTTIVATALVLFLSLALGGCASQQQAQERQGADRALIFGYLDTKESHTVLDAFVFAPSASTKDEDKFGSRVVGNDDAFFIENVKTVRGHSTERIARDFGRLPSMRSGAASCQNEASDFFLD